MHKSESWLAITRWHWLLGLVLARLLVGSYWVAEQHAHLPVEMRDGIMRIADDTRSYYRPIENWVEGHGYRRDGIAPYDQRQFVSYAGRLPGLAPIYAPLYALLGSFWARQTMVLLQLLASALSCWLLGLVAWRLWRRNGLALAVCWGYFFCYPLHILDLCGMTETFAVAAMVGALTLGVSYRPKVQEPGYLILAGILLTWMVFLRPVFGLWVLPLTALFWEKKRNWGSFVRVLGPLVLALGIWNARNAVELGRWVPLEDRWEISYPHEPEYRPAGLAIRKLIKSWGGDVLWWVQGSAGQALLHPDSTRAAAALPARAYVAPYTADSAARLRKLYLAASQFPPDTIARAEAVALARRWQVRYRTAHPFDAYVGSRLRLWVKLLGQRASLLFPYPAAEKLRTYQQLIKAGYIVLHHLLLGLGSLFALLFMWRGPPPIRIVAVMVLLMEGVLAVGLGLIEERYTLPLYPLCVLLLAAFAARLGRKN